MSDLVIDAGIAIKWVIDEVDTPQALALRRHRLFAPDLLTAECANVLWRKARRNELSAEEARFAARLLECADIELAPMRNLLEPATVLALTLNHRAHLPGARRGIVLRSDHSRSRASYEDPAAGYKSKIIGLTASEL